MYLAPILLVGNKADLRNDEDTIHELAKSGQTTTTFLDGEAMAERIGADKYIDCSAKLNKGVREVFETAVHAIRVRLVQRQKTF